MGCSRNGPTNGSTGRHPGPGGPGCRPGFFAIASKFVVGARGLEPPTPWPPARPEPIPRSTVPCRPVPFSASRGLFLCPDRARPVAHCRSGSPRLQSILQSFPLPHSAVNLSMPTGGASSASCLSGLHPGSATTGRLGTARKTPSSAHRLLGVLANTLLTWSTNARRHTARGRATAFATQRRHALAEPIQPMAHRLAPCSMRSLTRR